MRRGKDRSGKEEKVITIDLKTALSALMLLIMSFLILIGAVRFVRGFMKVSEFEILGDSPYEDEDIINATGIKKGDKLYALDEDTVIADIKRKCPYINNVTVDKKFPNKLKIEVDSFAATWYVEILGDYYALDGELRVLDERADEQRFLEAGVAKLTLPNIKSAVVGSTLIYGENELEIKFCESFMDMLKSTTFIRRVTLADIDNRFDVYIELDGKITVYMGNGDKSEDKIKAIQRALEDPKLENCISAEIDVSDVSAVSVRPVLNYEISSDTAEG